MLSQVMPRERAAPGRQPLGVGHNGIVLGGLGHLVDPEVCVLPLGQGGLLLVDELGDPPVQVRPRVGQSGAGERTGIVGGARAGPPPGVVDAGPLPRMGR